jgi:glycogen operon protein
MISGGDEVARTQHGNNNAYCQDNELSWTPWELSSDQASFLSFTRQLVALRRTYPVLRRRKFFQGRSIRGAGVKDICWLDPSGQEMTDAGWQSPDARALGVLLAGDAIDELDERAQRIVSDTLLVLYNAGETPVEFRLPNEGSSTGWLPVVDTARACDGGTPCEGDALYELAPHSMAVLRRVSSQGAAA